MKFGTGPFENDDAMAFIGDLIDEDDIEVLLDEVEGWEAVAPNEPFHVADAARIIAAAEIVAAVGGRPHARLPRDIAYWLSEREVPAETLRRRLLPLLDRVRRESDLAAAWTSTLDKQAWDSNVRDVAERLGQPAAIG